LPEKSSATEFNPQGVLDQFEHRKTAISKYITAYRQGKKGVGAAGFKMQGPGVPQNYLRGRIYAQ
jgi:hypothetical protein